MPPAEPHSSDASHANSSFQKPAWLSEAGLVLGIAFGLSVLFWSPLWLGCGLIGGDTNTYSLPLKAFYANQLQQGKLCLWNDLWGHGFPAHAESQTAVLYPPNLLMYSVLPLNDAYVLSQACHYILGFCGMWLLSRTLGLSRSASCLTSLIVIYGWFPPRISLDWAIITGAWMPWIVWAALRTHQHPTFRNAVFLAGFIALQLLAGHFNLAFLTLLLAICLVGFQLLHTRQLKPQVIMCLGLGIGLGFLLASVQLLPTWELKSNSQRSTVDSTDYSPAYGSLPPQYLSQLIMPWRWYTEPTQLDNRLNSLPGRVVNVATNKVEAHFYLSLTAIAVLLLGGLQFLLKKNQTTDSKNGTFPQTTFPAWFWIGLAVFSVLYATGILLSSVGQLPGFKFFTGPGRYTLLATLAFAMLAGQSLDQLTARGNRLLKTSISVLLILLATGEFWVVSGLIRDAFPTADPPMLHQAESPFWQLAQQSQVRPRLFAPGPNLVTLTGVSQTPVYLGLGPEEYYDQRLRVPEISEELSPQSAEWQIAMSQRMAWLQQAGVTHVLQFEPLNLSNSPLELIWEGYDPVLNRAWGRDEPLYLYALNNSRGPVFSIPSEQCEIEVVNHKPQTQTFQIKCSEDSTIVATELMFPGWVVRVDGEEAEAVHFEHRFRGVNVPAGSHTVEWTYEPQSFRWGAVLSLLALLCCLGLCIGKPLNKNQRATS